MTQNNDLDTLIQSLSDTPPTRKRLTHPLYGAVLWLIFAIGFLGSSLYMTGIRYDVANKLSDPAFVFELALIAMMSVSAAICALYLYIPDMRGKKWLIAVPMSLFGAFATYSLSRALLEQYGLPIPQFHMCYKNAAIFSVVPALAILVLSMRGKTTRPMTMAFMNALSVGGLGYLGLRLSCSMGDMGHLLVFHLLPYLAFGLVVGLLARYLYRW